MEHLPSGQFAITKRVFSRLCTETFVLRASASDNHIRRDMSTVGVSTY